MIKEIAIVALGLSGLGLIGFFTSWPAAAGVLLVLTAHQIEKHTGE